MSIPLILASKSKPRRDVLYSAGICPTIRVSHVDEPAALEAAAREEGVTVDDLSIKQRVMILAAAKAEAVHRAYRDVADTAAAATGDRVIAYPLKAKEIKDSEREAAVEDLRKAAAGKPIDYSKAEIATTRDFSGIDMPTVTEPIATAIAGQPGLTEATVGPLILGCDSMFLLGGECYGKPHSESVARERLKRMSGATGELWTGHCLIDFATGRTVRGASHAKVHFGEFTDDDIERYIVTGEPLEVAGSFTLEGFGGAFIDSIEGDPHGIIGLSLPLARHLAGELGITWTDLWNVGRGELEPESKASGNQHAGILPPVENVHQPGDGWVGCGEHWGTNGASGRDPAGKGLTWSCRPWPNWGSPAVPPDGESPIEGALRERRKPTSPPKHRGGRLLPRGPWPVGTVFAFAAGRAQGKRRRKHGNLLGPD